MLNGQQLNEGVGRREHIDLLLIYRREPLSEEIIEASFGALYDASFGF